MRKRTTTELITASMLLTIGVLLPFIFHSLGFAGPIFLPMHIPILIGGYILAPELAFALGLITPLFSSITTGMPVIFPIGIIMMFELSFYGLTLSILTRKYKKNTFFLLSLSMIVGRIVAAFTAFVLTLIFTIKLNPVIYIKGAIITGLPGIIIQLLIIPIIIQAIKKSNLSLINF